MKDTLYKTWVGLAAVAAAGLGGAAVAAGAGSSTTTTTTSTPETPLTGHGFGGHGCGAHGPGGNGETELTGEGATKAKAAAVAEVGGTVDRASTENDGSNAAAKYEVHVTKADGTHVEVILDKDFNVLSVETRLHHGPHP